MLKQMTQVEFQKMLLETLEWMTLRELAALSSCQVSDMKGWVKGDYSPLNSIMLLLKQKIGKERMKKIPYESRIGTYGGTRLS